MGLGGTSGIMKLVAFILIAAAFGLSFFMFKVGHGNAAAVAAVYGGFFGYYLAAFIGVIVGGEIDSEMHKTWAIYGTCALFGVGFYLMYGNTNCGDNNTECMLLLISGILGIVASVICFLDAFFSG